LLIPVLLAVPGLRGFRLHGRGDSDPAGTLRTVAPAVPLQPAEFVHLDAGTSMSAGEAPPGWSHLVLETVPRLATGDLDTVSAQAFETAQRVRPLIVADVRRAAGGGERPFHLARVGVGLCAPGREPDTRVVVSPTSVEGTHGPWTTKQRLILTAMSLETSRADLPSRTPTFALLRSPVTFLVGGSHEKLFTYTALLVDPATGSLDTVVWLDRPGDASKPARRASVQVFDSPMDVKATKVASIPVAWTFGMRELPPGADVELPIELRDALKRAGDDSAPAGDLEAAFRRLLGQ
jgi:hypothetical protein